MLALMYLILATCIGKEILEHFLIRKMKNVTGNTIWVILPMSFGCGVLVTTWILYGLAYLNCVFGKSKVPLFAANIGIFFLGSTYLLAAFFRKRAYHINDLIKRTGDPERRGQRKWISNPVLFKKEAVLFTVLFLFLTGICFYVFQIKDGNLYAGYTVFSDYAPHTAMIRSFSRGSNFPTQYPHCGGEDVKYHFMFQFLTGNLEYLGMRLDLAYNLVSVLSLESFLMMLYMMAGRIMGRYLVGALTVGIFFFRSGISFFRFAWEHIQAGDLWETLCTNTTFIGYTPNENWGLWCFNVYLNQRHLAFGLLIVCIALWIFLDWLESEENRQEKGTVWFFNRLFSPKAWKSKDVSLAVLTGVLLGLTSFWNGAAVIGGLLILAGFGLFSVGKLDYAILAAVTILFSVIQTSFFMEGSSFGFSFYWGLLAADHTLSGVFTFLLYISGVYFLGLIIVGFFLDRYRRVIMTAFLIPVVFAFTMSLTPDIAVNHKYVMISYAMLAMFWAWILEKLWRKNLWLKAVAVLLSIVLLATGIYDFVIIIKDNDRYHRLAVSMESELTDWLSENVSGEDLVLTAEYSMNEVTMSGIMMYNGWPYYAWSAGYDTGRRTQTALDIFTGDDPETVRTLVKREKITYIVYEADMRIEDHPCREDIIAELYPMVYRSADERFHIYAAE